MRSESYSKNQKLNEYAENICTWSSWTTWCPYHAYMYIYSLIRSTVPRKLVHRPQQLSYYICTWRSTQNKILFTILESVQHNWKIYINMILLFFAVFNSKLKFKALCDIQTIKLNNLFWHQHANIGRKMMVLI